MKKRVIYKVIACIMSFAMLTSSLPEFYTRAYTEEINNGIVWEYFSDTGLLQISGSGDMQDFASSDEAPWKNHSENVRRVEILDGVTAIANFAFSGMAKLETVDIAESVTRIGASAFAYCDSLYSVYIPENVQEIGIAAFCNDTSLSEITVSESNNYFTATNGVLFDKNKTRLIAYPAGKTAQNYVIVEGVAVIEDFAFYANPYIRKLTFPLTVTDIGAYGLANTALLTDIEYPGTVNMWDSMNCGTGWDENIAWNTPTQEWTLYYNASIPITVSGKCGDNLTWTIDTQNKVLTINGTGEMYDFADRSAPWRIYRDYIIKVVIEDGVTSIGDGAFKECTSIVSASISNGVKRIGKAAFYGCVYLAIINIPFACEVIDDYAFFLCINVSTLYIPGTKIIGNYAFYGCKALTSLNIDNTLANIGDNAFASCQVLANIYYNGNIIEWEMVKKGTGWNSSSPIKVSCAGSSYTSSGSCGNGLTWRIEPATATLVIEGTGWMESYSTGTVPWDYWKKHIRTIDIRSNITNIGSYAFKNFSALTEVKTQKVGKIYDNAFENCTLLTDFDLPDNVSEIGQKAFYGCSSLKEINLPDTLTTIGTDAFVGCIALESINVSEGNSEYSSTDGVLFSKNGISLITCPPGMPTEEYTVPEGVQFVENKAFYGCHKIKRLKGYTPVGGAYTYYGCTSLEEITLPEGAKTIGNYVFANCTSLKSITLPQNVTTVNKGAFSGCSALESVYLPKNIKKIVAGAFAECNSLKNIYYAGTAYKWNGVTKEDGWDTNAGSLTEEGTYTVIFGNEADDLGECGDGVRWEYMEESGALKILGNGAMSDMAETSVPWNKYDASIKSIEIADGITHIGNNAFSGCASVTEIALPQSVETIGGYAFSGCTQLKSVTLPGRLTSIGNYAFYRCTALEGIVLPDTLTKIGNGSFSSCTRLKNVTLPEGLTAIGASAFAYCSSFTKISIPGGITVIPESAFKNCTTLVQVILPDGITEIGENAFSGCNLLSHIKLPNGVTVIGDYAFSGCELILQMTFPEALTSIGSYAFSGCKSFTRLDIPVSVSNIGSYAFSDCVNIENIYYPGNNVKWNNIIKGTSWDNNMGSETETGIYKLNYGEPNIYSGSAGDNVTWTLYEENGQLVISGSGEMTEYKGSSYTPWYEYRDLIKSVEAAEGVTSIGDYAFYYYKNIEEVSIHGTKVIGNSAFEGCSSLASISFGEGIENIENDAFARCGALESINLPESLTRIGYRTFSYCSKLADIYYAGSENSWNAIEKGGNWNQHMGDNAPTGACTIHYAKENYYSGTLGDLSWELWEEQGRLIISGSGTMYTGSSYTSVPWYQYRQFIRTVEIGEGVESIGRYAFYGCNNLTEISIPKSLTDIESNAFYGCISLVDIDIPDNVTHIGSDAFNGCTAIKIIKLPEKISYIYSGLFNGCTSLMSVSIPVNVTAISDKAFYNCTALESITIPESVERIGNYAFYNCTALADMNYQGDRITWAAITKGTQWDYKAGSGTPDGSYSINYGRLTYYNGSCGENLAWSLCEDTGVLEITGSGAMYDITDSSDVPWASVKSKIQTVVIASGVTTICNYAFYGNKNVLTFTFPDSLVSIGKQAFYGCSLPESITIPEGVTDIGDEAFYKITTLKTVYLPKSVKNIGHSAFMDCNYLSDIYYAGSENVWADADKGLWWDNGCGTDTDSGSYTLHFGEENGILSECGKNLTWNYSAQTKILEISGTGKMYNMISSEYAPWAEYRDEISIVKIGEGVTHIGKYTFDNMSALTEVTVPLSVTEIGLNAFAYCPFLEKVNYAGNESDWASVKKTSWCTNSGTQTSAGKVTVYYGKANNINGSCGDNLYWEFDEVENTLKISGTGAMSDMSAYADAPWHIYRDMIYILEIESGITQISGYAFNNMKKLDVIYFGGSVYEWNDIEKDIDWDSHTGEETQKGIYTLLFGGESSMEGTLPGGLMWELSLESGILKLYNGDITSSDTELTASPWYNYIRSLKTVEIGENVNSIGSNAFRNYPVKNIIIHEGLSSIARYAFRGCSEVENIYYLGDMNSWENISKTTGWDAGLGSSESPYTIHFRHGGEPAYCGDTIEWELDDDGNLHLRGYGDIYDYTDTQPDWSVYKDKIRTIRLDEGITSIGANAFSWMHSLESIDIPMSVNRIGENAFSYCVKLSDINYGGTASTWSAVTKGNMWDDKAGYLTPEKKYSLNFGSDIVTSGVCGDDAVWEYIPGEKLLKISGSGAMYDYDCIGAAEWYLFGALIEEVEVEEGVTHIGAHTFTELPSLKKVTIPESVTSIGEFSFANTEKLSDIYYAGSSIGWKEITKGEYWDDWTGSLTEKGSYKVHYGKILSHGICGDELTWEYIPNEKTLRISGEGEMYDLDSVEASDWYTYKADIEVIEIAEGASSIGNYAFCDFSLLNRIIIPESVTRIGEYALSGCTKLEEIIYRGSSSSWDLAEKGNMWDNGAGTATESGSYAIEFAKVSGTCGDNLTWELLKDEGIFVLSGSGDMKHHSTTTDIPWKDYRALIKEVVVEEGITSVGTYAFIDCLYLTDVTLPESLVTIGSNAFLRCYALEAVTIPKNVTTLKSYAFSNCTALEGINIPDSVTSIESGVFSSCTALKTINLPETLTTIGDYAFRSCTSLESITLPGSITDMGSNLFSECSSLREITLSEGMTAIGDFAFERLSALETVNLPETLTTIGNDAFRNCTALESINLPGNLTSIGSYVFAGCTALTEVTITEGITQLSQGIFSGCNSLAGITLPESLTNIGSSAFSGCSMLGDIYYAGDKEQWELVTKSGRYWDSGIGSKTESGTYTIHYGKASITSGECGDNLFWEFKEAEGILEITGSGNMTDYSDSASVPWAKYVSKITGISIADGVTGIGSYAFSGCTNITEISLGKEIIKIGDYAFDGCTKLDKINFSGFDTDWDNISKGNMWDNNVGSATSDKTYTVVITAGICGDNLTWNYQPSEKLLVISGSGAMYDWETISDVSWSGYRTQIQKVAVGEGVTTLGKNSFNYFSALADVTLPESLITIGDNAFVRCSMLSSITIPGNVTTIGAGAFSSCGKLTEIILPNSVTAVGNNAFNGCTSLVKAQLPSGLTSLGDYTFYNCSKLSEITIPDSITQIGNYTFYRCGSLKEINIPEVVTAIGNEAFSNCAGLSDITLPKSVTRIGDTSFISCESLADIYYLGSEADWNKIKKGFSWDYNAGKATSKGTYTLHFAEESVYSGTLGDNITWELKESEGILRITGTGPMPSMSGYELAWKDCINCIKEAVISEGITLISSYAFYNCSALEDVTIPSSIATISSNVFEGCTGLTTVTVPEGVTTIGMYAFKDCTGIREIHLPESLTTVGTNMLFGCSALSDIYFAGTVEKWNSIADFMHLGIDADACTVHYGKIEEEIITNGSCGDNLFWEYVEDEKLLKITGSGDMQDFSDANDVPWYDFAGNIERMEISPDVTSIGSHAFENFTLLTEVTLPDGIRYIGEYAFGCCWNLSDLYYDGTQNEWDNIEKGDLWDIDAGLYTATGTYNLHCSEENFFFGECGDNMTWTLDTDAGRLEITGDGEMYDWGSQYEVPWYEYRSFIREVYISSGVKSIGSYAFSQSGIEKINLPDSIRYIGDRAFYNCQNLRSIRIPVRVSEIRPYTFYRCTVLDRIDLPEKLSVIYERAFAECVQLSNIYYAGSPNSWDGITKRTYWNMNTGKYSPAGAYTIHYGKDDEPVITSGECGENLVWNYDTHNRILEISGDGAMYDYRSSDEMPWYHIKDDISDVLIGDGVTYIGSNAFSDSRSIVFIRIPKSVKKIDAYAIKDIAAFLTISYEGSEILWKEVEKPEELNESGIYSIQFEEQNIYTGKCGDKLFWEYYEMDCILKIYGEGEMYSFSSASEVPWYKYRTMINTVEMEEGITTIGDYAFANLISVWDIPLPESVEHIGNSAFFNCTGINNMHFGINVKTVGDWAFFNCMNLSWININEGVTDIGDWAFFNCTSLNHISLNEGVLNIGDWAFYNCLSLDTIDLPSSLETIGDNAFAGCDNLWNVNYNGKETDWNGIKIGVGNDYLINTARNCNPPYIELTETEVTVHTEYTEEAYEAVLTVASYDGDRLVDIRLIPVTEYTTELLGDDGLGLEYYKGNTIKAFMWNNTDELVPMCLSKSVTVK